MVLSTLFSLSSSSSSRAGLDFDGVTDLDRFFGVEVLLGFGGADFEPLGVFVDFAILSLGVAFRERELDRVPYRAAGVVDFRDLAGDAL